jgi:hypothetical protein
LAGKVLQQTPYRGVGSIDKGGKYDTQVCEFEILGEKDGKGAGRQADAEAPQGVIAAYFKETRRSAGAAID